MGALGGLRHEPTEKRVRARRGDAEVVDSTRALLVWEPRRIVPSYAVPVEDVRARLEPSSEEESSDAELLHPGIPFGAHSTEGESLDVELAGETLRGAAFRPADPDLAGHVILAYDAFDGWFEKPTTLTIERIGMDEPRPIPSAERIIDAFEWAGDFIYVAGRRGIDPKTDTLVQGEEARVRQACLNMTRIAGSIALAFCASSPR